MFIEVPTKERKKRHFPEPSYEYDAKTGERVPGPSNPAYPYRLVEQDLDNLRLRSLRREVYEYLAASISCLLFIILTCFAILYCVYWYQTRKQRVKTAKIREATRKRLISVPSQISTTCFTTTTNFPTRNVAMSCENPMYVLTPVTPPVPQRVMKRSPSRVTIRSELQKIVNYANSGSNGGKDGTATPVYGCANPVGLGTPKQGRYPDGDSGSYVSIDGVSTPTYILAKDVFTVCKRVHPEVKLGSSSTRLKRSRNQETKAIPKPPQRPLPLCAAAIPSMEMSFLIEH